MVDSCFPGQYKLHSDSVCVCVYSHFGVLPKSFAFVQTCSSHDADCNHLEKILEAASCRGRFDAFCMRKEVEKISCCSGMNRAVDMTCRCALRGFSTTQDRVWTTDLTNIPAEGILAAAVAAIPIVMFFYLDQNISSIMCQKPDMKTKKGSYFHSSFACMALFNLLGPIWGLPFVTGSLPHSPQFVHAMTVVDKKHKPVGVVENRVAPCVGYGLLGSCFILVRLLREKTC